MCEVTIDLGRYSELLDTETRVDVAVQQIINQKYIRTEDVLRILGTDEALREADRLKEDDERQERERKGRYWTSEETGEV